MRRPRPMTAARVAFAARRYLERYITSSSHLRELLREKVRREARALGTDPEQWYPLVDTEITRLIESGALDDQRFATDRTRSLHRRGSSAHRIRSALRSKGLPSDVITQALGDLSEEHEGSIEEPDLAAARTFARKRRLGPFRRSPVDEEGRKRELGKMVRAGFSWSIARQIVDENPASDAPEEDEEDE